MQFDGRMGEQVRFETGRQLGGVLEQNLLQIGALGDKLGYAVDC